MFQDTLSVTMLQAGFKPNVIPTRAEATLDIRVLPTGPREEVVSEIRQNLPTGPFSLGSSNRLRPPLARGKRFFSNA